MKDMQRIEFRIEPSLKQQLKAAAKAQRMSLSKFMVEAAIAASFQPVCQLPEEQSGMPSKRHAEDAKIFGFCFIMGAVLIAIAILIR